MAEIAVHGLPELRKVLEDMPAKVQRKILGKAVRDGAVIVRDIARASAPSASGALRRNVQVRKVRYADGVKYIIGVEVGTIVQATGGRVVRRAGRHKVKVVKASRREKRGENPFYYRFQELGFTAVGTHKGGSGRKIPGKHFLENSLNRNADRIVETIKTSISKQLDELVKP